MENCIFICSGVSVEDMSSELTQDVFAANNVQAGDGCFTVTFPKAAAEDFGIEAGDAVIFVGEKGDDGLMVRTSDGMKKRLNQR